MHDDTELIRMQTPCCLISTGHIGNKCEKLDLKNQGYGSASESEQEHPWGWAAFLMADVLRTRAIISLTSWSEMPTSFAYAWNEAVEGWLASGLHFSLSWCVPTTNLSLHASILPQLSSDTCHISYVQVCTLEAAPYCPGAIIITLSLSMSSGQQKATLDPRFPQSSSHTTHTTKLFKIIFINYFP